MGAVSRSMPVALAGLLLTLLVFGFLADRALVGQATAAGEVAAARVDETARLVALSVRADLAQVEQAVAAGRPRAAVITERSVLPPPPSAPHEPFVPYRKRPRAELSALLGS